MNDEEVKILQAPKPVAAFYFEHLFILVGTVSGDIHDLGKNMLGMLGGVMIDDQVCQYVGADYWLKDAMSGGRSCRSLLTEVG